MIRLLRRTGTVCLYFALSSLSTAYAANSDAVPENLTLADAIALVLQHNPDLAVSAYELKIGDARVTQVEIRPNPELSLAVENFAGSGEVEGTRSIETTLSLSQTIELGNKRNNRITTAHLNRELSGMDRQAQQLDVLADATRKFVDVVQAQQALELSRGTRELAEQTLAVITVRVQAARTPFAEKSRAAIAVTRARIAEQNADAEVQMARHDLAALWGSDMPGFQSASADLFALPTIASFDELKAHLQNNPDFLRFATEERLREAEWRLAQSQARPDLNISVGVRHLQASGDTALVAVVSMPLSLFNRNQGQIREAEVRHEQLRVQSRSTFVRAQSLLFRLYQRALTTGSEVAQLRDVAIPQAQTALAQTRDGYERGRFSYLELATAQQELFELQSAAIEAAADYHRLIAEIERLTREPMVAVN